MAVIKLPITIGRYTIPHQFWVASDKDCLAQMLLGSDFIRHLNKTGLPLSLDLHRHVISIGEEHCDLIHVNSILRSESPLHVVTDGRVTLPRRTTSIIRTKIRGISPVEATDVLIEDNQRLTDDLYVVGRALIPHEPDGTCFINIMNPSSTDIEFKDKTKPWATPVVYPEVQILAVHYGTSEHGTTVTIPPEADWETRLPKLPATSASPAFDIVDEVDLFLQVYHR
ncbi:unnamed protein product [Heligmosomoides polygyrus]|uniref:Peptidase A2 domain-containing protein n=1 Tax=Heligmosomoides polygyrus TaxID=6339 RepID=A0A183FI76_HELPZ|nr:unnamed protein product [Heligmosomoides polygyrus]